MTDDGNKIGGDMRRHAHSLGCVMLGRGTAHSGRGTISTEDTAADITRRRGTLVLSSKVVPAMNINASVADCLFEHSNFQASSLSLQIKMTRQSELSLFHFLSFFPWSK